MILPNYAVIFDAVGIVWFLGFMLHDVFKLSRNGAAGLALIFLVLSGLSIAGLLLLIRTSFRRFLF